MQTSGASGRLAALQEFPDKDRGKACVTVVLSVFIMCACEVFPITRWRNWRKRDESLVS